MFKRISVTVYFVYIVCILGCTPEDFKPVDGGSGEGGLNNIGFDSQTRSLSSITALGSTYYVCGNATSCGTGWGTGSDTRTKSQAKSKLTPWKTIDYAENQALPGDVVVVGSGIYNTTSTESSYGVLFIKKGGLAGKPISIRSEKKWGAIIDAMGIHSGVFFYCNVSAPPSYVRIDGFEIRNSKYTGVYSKDSGAPYNSYCQNLELTNLKIHHVGHVGVALETTKTSLVASNLIYAITTPAPNHNQYHGIYLSDNTEDILVKNNVIYGITEGWPIHIYDGHGLGPAKSHKVINNTLINDNRYRAGGVVMYGTLHVIRNNLIYQRASLLLNYNGAISDRSSQSHSGTIVQNNITNLTKLCANGCEGATIGGNILSASFSKEFVAPSSNNYRLLSTAVSLDRGTLSGYTSRAGAATDDFDNRTRYLGKAPDVGAFESSYSR